MKITDLKEFDAADFINDEEDILNYLNVVLEENDPGALAEALGTIARSQGMTKISEGSGIAREALYKALRPQSAPRFDTITRVCRTLGFKFVLEPINVDNDKLAHS